MFNEKKLINIYFKVRKMHAPEYSIPLLNIRHLLMSFKLNFAAQSFIEENVPSLKKLLTYSVRDNLIQNANDMLLDLFDKYGLDLTLDISLEDAETITYLTIVVIHGDIVHEEIFTIEDENLLDGYSGYRNELLLDKEY